jgi:hypothetical protein
MRSANLAPWLAENSRAHSEGGGNGSLGQGAELAEGFVRQALDVIDLGHPELLLQARA